MVPNIFWFFQVTLPGSASEAVKICLPRATEVIPVTVPR
jgi:hypothetical protein